MNTVEPKPSGHESIAASVPDNLFVLVAHGSWEIPDYQARADRYFDGEGAGKLSPHFTREDGLVAKDGSDYAVGMVGHYMLNNLGHNTVSNPPRAGRMFVNPNGARQASVDIRETTFGDVPVWDEMPSADVQEQIVKEIWDTYHDRIQAGAEMVALESAPNDHTLFVDIHDTDTHVLNEAGEWVDQPLDDEGNQMPILLVSDRDGKAAHPVVRGILGNQLLGSLVEEGLISAERAEAEGFKENFIYKGGYTTQRYGLDLPNAYLLRGDDALREKAHHLHFIQIELDRTMYLLNDRSGVDAEKMAATQRAVQRALVSTAEAIRHLELGDWRAVPEAGSEEYARAMSMPLLAANPHWYNRARPS